MRARWGKSITRALTEGDHGLIVDLRSGTYMNLGKVPGAITATVLTTDGNVVSHFNKHQGPVGLRSRTPPGRRHATSVH